MSSNEEREEQRRWTAQLTATWSSPSVRRRLTQAHQKTSCVCPQLADVSRQAVRPSHGLKPANEPSTVERADDVTTSTTGCARATSRD